MSTLFRKMNPFNVKKRRKKVLIELYLGFKGSAFTEAKFKCAKGLYDKFKKK